MNFREFLFNLLNKLKKNDILFLMNFIIFITGSFFIYFNLITISHLIFFFKILLFILIYKLIFYILKNLKINNKKVLKFLIYFNKYRNPLILLFIKLEEYIFDILCIYDKNGLKKFFFFIFIFIINPIKVFFYKFYTILHLGRSNYFFRIVFLRMFGLILSVLIFTNLIFYLKEILNTNIFGVIYFYLFITALLSFFKNKHECKNKYLKIFLVPSINGFNVISSRLHVNIISLIISYNDIEELPYYIDHKNMYKIEKFCISYTGIVLNSVKEFKNKPSYGFYSKVRFYLDDYLFFLLYYIYMNITNGDTENMYKIEFNGKLNNFDLLEYEKVKFIYKFDYKILKLLLFVFWDLEKYLGNDVIRSIEIDDDLNSVLFSSTFGSVKNEEEFYGRIKINKNKLSFNEEFLFKIKPYLFYSGFYSKKENLKYTGKEENTDFKYYKKLFLILPIHEIEELQFIRNYNSLDYKKEHEEYLDILYREGLNLKDKTIKYEELLKELEEDLVKIKKLSSNS